MMIDFSRRRRMNCVRGHGTSDEGVVVIVVVGDGLDGFPIFGGFCGVADVLVDL